MATTKTTEHSYTGNGSTTNYTVSFEYLKEADVKVTLDHVATTAYTFANATFQDVAILWEFAPVK